MTDRVERSIAVPLGELRFKGRRDYLHGTDILPMCVRALEQEYPSSAIADFDITFHSLARSGLTLCGSAPPGVTPRVQLSCAVDGVKTRFVLIDDGREVVDRIDYPEEQIVAATTIDTGLAQASSAGALPFLDVERWIAMVKALHAALFPALPGRWLWVRGKLKRFRASDCRAAAHRVVLQSNFNNRLTRTALFVDDEQLGEIFFSLD
jgi:hypothetical protein